MIEIYNGGCHCSRVRFRVRADLAGLLECNCSICTKKGILHLIVPPEQFELLQGEEDLATYQFNTNTAKHTFCRHCGIHAFYVPRSDPRQDQRQRPLPGGNRSGGAKADQLFRRTKLGRGSSGAQKVGQSLSGGIDSLSSLLPRLNSRNGLPSDWL